MLKFSKMIFLKEFYFFQGQQKKSFKFWNGMFKLINYSTNMCSSWPILWYMYP
jgi:hypothetical protein